MTILALACFGGLLAVLVPPFFTRRAAVLWLSIDEYELGVIAPVRFGYEDLQGFDAALSGRLARRIEPDGGPRVLEFHTAEALEKQLPRAIAGLPLNGRDTLVTILRGQAVVQAGVAGPRAVFLPEDAKPGPDGVLGSTAVGCRELFEKMCASPALTNLVVFDQGDLRWDPRLAVAGGRVPAQLDEETRMPLADASRRCWVLGSHDTHEFSGVCLEDRRGIFLRAVELGLEGRADERAWGGDGDGWVELQELAAFVAEWTTRWSSALSDRRFVQHPVLWELGKGRVPPGEAPETVRLIRAGERTNSDIKSSAGRNAGGRVLWDLVDRIDDRSSADPTRPFPIDFAPHLWRQTAALAAAVAPGDEIHPEGRSRELAARLEQDLERVWESAADAAGSPHHVRDELERLADAWRDTRRDLGIAWGQGDPELRHALVVRNRAAALIAAALDWYGASAGSAVSEPTGRLLPAALDALASLHGELSKRARGQSAVEPATRLPVERLEKELRRVEREVETACESLADQLERGGPLPATDLHWLLATRLPTAAQRHALAAALAARLSPPGDGAQGSPESDGARGTAPDDPTTADADTAPPPRGEANQPRQARQLLLPDSPPIQPLPQVVATAEKNTLRLEDQFRERAGLLGRMIGILDGDAGRPATRAAGLEGQGEQPAELHADAVAGAGAMARDIAGVPQKIRDLRPARGSAARDSIGTEAPFLIDSLLRLADPRDAGLVDPAILGWMPGMRALPPLRLAVRAEQDQLEFGRDQRISVALQSAAPLPRDGVFTINFDAQRLQVRREGAGELQPAARISVGDLADRDRLMLLVRPTRRLDPGTSDRMAALDLELASGQTVETARRAFLLPLAERLSIAVRGLGGTVDGGSEGAEGWRSVPLDALVSAAGQDRPVLPAESGPEIRLRTFPGRTTSFEVELENQTGEPRLVEAEVVALDADGSAERLRTSLEARRPLPTGTRRSRTSGPVRLPAGRQRVPLIFQPLEAAPKTEPPQDPGDAIKTAREPPLPVRIALVVRDVDPPAGAADAAPESAPPPAPSTPRAWLLFLKLEPRHPGRYLEPRAVWSAVDRSIVVTVLPRGGDTSLLPNGEVRIATRKRDLPERQAAAGEGLTLTKVEGVLTAREPRLELAARWQGADAEKPEFALEVDGYPRAFVFQLDCNPAMNGRPQDPQRDLRRVQILEPRTGHQYRSPLAAIPVTLAVDAPADAFPRSAVGLWIRQDRGAAGPGGVDIGPPAWERRAERQIDFYWNDTPPEPGAISIETRASDWNVDLATGGLNDCDARITAVLQLPADQTRQADGRVVLDGTPPVVRTVRAIPPRIAKGKPLLIEVESDDGGGGGGEPGRGSGASGIARVEWGIDANGDGRADAPQPMAANADGRTVIQVDTGTLAPGRHAVIVQAVDRVDQKSRPAEAVFDVEAAPPP